MQIREYTPKDKEALFALMKDEGEEWSDYYAEQNRAKFEAAFENSIVYVLLEDNTLCGYIRCKTDHGYGVYIFDLLVSKQHRGKGYGRCLIQTICKLFPNEPVYANSDADIYYQKQGFQKVGSIFQVK